MKMLYLFLFIKLIFACDSELVELSKIVQNAERSMCFYKNVVKIDHCFKINLIEDSHLKSISNEPNPTENHWAFWTTNIDDALSRLLANDVLFLKRELPKDKFFKEDIVQVFFRDPDGYLLEIIGNQTKQDLMPVKLHHITVVNDSLQTQFFENIGLVEIPRPNFKEPGAWFQEANGIQIHLVVRPGDLSLLPSTLWTFSLAGKIFKFSDKFEIL